MMILLAQITEWMAGLAMTGVLGSYAAIFGVYQWQSKRAERQVFRDVCDERTKRIEGKIDAVGEQVKGLCEEMKEHLHRMPRES